jgi:hypothetical protein
MDTLIFGALLLTLGTVVRQHSRTRVLLAWWLTLAATVALLIPQLSGDLTLGLGY